MFFKSNTKSAHLFFPCQDVFFELSRICHEATSADMKLAKLGLQFSEILLWQKLLHLRLHGNNILLPPYLFFSSNLHRLVIVSLRNKQLTHYTIDYL